MADDGFKVPNGTAEPYAAGGNGRRLRAWRPSYAGPNAVLSRSLSLIRARNRSAVRNDAWAGACSDKLVSNMIGTGVQARSKAGDPARKEREKALWNAWVKVSDADGILDFYGQQSMVAREWHEAGEGFARIRRRRAADGLPVPMQVQIIEAEQCPAEYDADLASGNRVRMGVEFNKIGRRVAYWMYREHPGDFALYARDMRLTRVPAEEVMHVYEPLRAGQIRGVPDGTGALVRMFNLDNLEDAVLERQKIANLFAGWYVNKGEGDQGEMVDDMQTGEDDGIPLAGLEPGTMQELPRGIEPEFSKPPDAGNNYPDYLRSQLMAIAARHGVPYEVLTGDLRGVSDRALRLILNEFRRRIEQRQWLFLIPQFCQRVREAWWDSAVLAGAIDAPGYADRRAEYVDTLWVPQGWPYSHPVQDVDADSKAIEAGLTSRTETILGNGGDPEEVDAEQAEDNARADSLGLVYSSDGRAQSKTTSKRANKGGSDEPEDPAASHQQQPVNVSVEPAQVHVTLPAIHNHSSPVTVNSPVQMPEVLRFEQPAMSEQESALLQRMTASFDSDER